jgi:hypothetical protein
LFLPWFL